MPVPRVVMRSCPAAAFANVIDHRAHRLPTDSCGNGSMVGCNLKEIASGRRDGASTDYFLRDRPTVVAGCRLLDRPATTMTTARGSSARLFVELVLKSRLPTRATRPGRRVVSRQHAKGAALLVVNSRTFWCAGDLTRPRPRNCHGVGRAGTGAVSHSRARSRRHEDRYSAIRARGGTRRRGTGRSRFCAECA